MIPSLQGSLLLQTVVSPDLLAAEGAPADAVYATSADVYVWNRGSGRCKRYLSLAFGDSNTGKAIGDSFFFFFTLVERLPYAIPLYSTEMEDDCRGSVGFIGSKHRSTLKLYRRLHCGGHVEMFTSCSPVFIVESDDEF